MNINEIANLATKKKKPNKAQLWAQYKTLVSNLDGNDSITNTDNNVLVDMYNHFQPATPAKPKTPQQWLAKAMAGKGEVRHYLQYIYADGSNLVATDGNRLHIWTVSDVADGYYDKNMQKINEDAKFPDYKRVLPLRTGNSRRNSLLTKAELLAGEVKVYSGKEEAINVVGEVWVKKQCLLDALSFWDSSERVEINYEGKMDNITISANDCLAVVMPIRL
jgi:hypothetical protein